MFAFVLFSISWSIQRNFVRSDDYVVQTFVELLHYVTSENGQKNHSLFAVFCMTSLCFNL